MKKALLCFLTMVHLLNLNSSLKAYLFIQKDPAHSRPTGSSE